MGARIWQTPGTTERAEWTALSTDPLWEVVGGMWARPGESGHFVVLVEIIPVAEAGDEPVYGQARWVDLDRVTLPEKRRLFFGTGVPSGLDLLRGLSRLGYGHSIASAYGTNSKAVRSEIKQVVDAIKLDEARLPEVPRVHHRRWDKIREQDPVSYMVGFMLGMRRGDLTSEQDEVTTVGWEHGWEYAVGRAPLPDWFSESRKERGSG
jgi:hypothetical protein